MNQKSILLTVIVFLMSYGSIVAQKSLYSDVKAHKPGDVITVVLTENINGTSSSDMRNRSQTAASTNNSATGSVVPMEATFGVNSNFDFNSDERVLSNQRQLLRGTLSVRIVDVDENGNYMVQGNRRTEISGEIYKMSVEGYVRAEDINDANEVLSYRIADADITYLSEGGFGSMRRKRGFGRRVLWGFIAIVTVASAGMAAN